MHYALLALLLVLGGLWKLWDGKGGDGLTWLRSICLVVLLAAAAYTSAPDDWLAVLCMVVFTGLSITLGHTEWEDPVWQFFRYAGFAALATHMHPYVAHSWIYIAACGMAGVTYTFLFWLDDVLGWDGGGEYYEQPGLPRFWIFDGPEAYARIPLGAVLIGGLAFL